MRNVIINADDFGFSDHTVDWTVKCFEAGVLSSATIMAGAATVARAVQFANQNPQWSFGLHLCLTDVRPICLPCEIPSMVTQAGLFWPTRVFMLRSSLGLVKRDDLEKEIRAQVQRLRDLGVTISHLDGHGHMHRLPFVLKSLIRLAKELGLTRLRPAQDLYFTPPSVPFGKWLNHWVNPLVHHHFKAPDHFLMTSGKVNEIKSMWFQDAIARLPSGFAEIGVHPGMNEPWRVLDTDFLFHKGKDVLAHYGVSLSTYRERV